MQPISSQNLNNQVLSNQSSQRSGPTVEQILKFFTHQDVHKLQVCSQYLRTLPLTEENLKWITGVETLCTEALDTLRIKSDKFLFKNLSEFQKECLGYKQFPIITDLNIAEVIKQGINQANQSLIFRASDYIHAKAGFCFYLNINGSLQLACSGVLNEEKINYFKMIYPHLAALFTKGFHLSYTQTMPKEILNLIAKHLFQIHIKKEVNLQNLAEIVKTLPHLKEITLEDVALNDQIASFLLSVNIPVQVMYSSKKEAKIETSKRSFAALMEAGILGKPLLLTPASLFFHLLDQDFVDLHPEQCLHYFLRARFQFFEDYVTGDYSDLIPENLLNEDTEMRLLKYSVEHMIDPDFHDNGDAFPAEFGSDLRLSFEQFSAIAGPATSDNLELKFANACFFKNKEEFKICLIEAFKSTGCSIEVIPDITNDFSVQKVKIRFDSPIDIDRFRTPFNRLNKYFHFFFELECIDRGDKLQEFCQTLGSSLSTLILGPDNVLNQKQLGQIFNACPNIESMVLDHFPFLDEHEKPIFCSPVKQIDYIGIENTEYKNRFMTFHQTFLLRHWEKCCERRNPEIGDWLLNQDNVIQNLKLNTNNLKLKSYIVDHSLKCLQQKYYDSDIANQNHLEFAELYTFIKDNKHSLTKPQLIQFSLLFALIDDIGMIIPKEEQIEITVATLDAIEIEIPYTFVNSENVDRLIAFHLRFPNSLRAVCFKYFEDHFKIKLAYHHDTLEIKLLASENSALGINSLLKMCEGYSFLTFATDRLLSQKDIEQLKILFIKVVSLRLTPTIVSEGFTITDTLKLCKHLKFLILDKLELTKDELNSCITFEKLRALGILNSPSILDLSALQESCLEFVSLINLSIRELPQINLKEVRRIKLKNLALDDLSILKKFSSSQKIEMDHVTLSEPAKDQLCQLIQAGKALVLDHVSLGENPFQRIFSNISGEAFKNLFPYVYEIFRDNQTKKQLLFQKLLLRDDKDFWFFEKFQAQILRHIPPNSKENVALYPILCKTDQPQKLKLWLPALMPLYYPFKVLDVISSNFKSFQSMRIHHYENQGDDQSGLSRQFLTLLFQGLVESSSEQIRITKQTKGYLLCEGHRLSDQDYKNMKTLGKLMILAAFSSGHYLIGEVFSNSMFSVILNLSENELEGPLKLERSLELYGYFLSREEEEKRIVPYKEIKTCKNLIELTPKHKEYLVCMGIELESIDQIHRELDEHFQSLCNQNLNLIRVIACGMKEALPMGSYTKWSQFNQVDPVQFARLIQGTFDVTRLKKLIQIFQLDDGERQLTAEELANPLVTPVILGEWISEWLDQHNEDEIRNVLQAITGGRSLSRRITFHLSNQILDLFAQTCSMAVDVPNRLTKEAFFDRLNRWAEGTDIHIFTQK